MDPKDLEFYINPAGTMFYQGNFAGYVWGPEIFNDEMAALLLKAAGGRDVLEKHVQEALRLANLWNVLRDNVSTLRTLTIHHVEAFLEPGERRGGAAVFVQLREPTSSPGFRRKPQRKRWGKGGEGYYIVRQEAVNLAQALEDAGYVSFVEDRGLGKWDVGVYVSTPREAKDVTRFIEAYIRAEMPLRLEWFTMA